MRIIAGKRRGRKLAAFGGYSIRPTPDRVKESLFQILQSRLAGARVLDLFAGTGALGLEALSRGAEDAVFNDTDAASVALIKKNLALLEERRTVYTLPFETCLTRLGGQFDLIFCDPPYKETYCGKVLEIVAAQRLLKAGGLVVYESEREETAPAGWQISDFRSYGRTKVFFFSEDRL